MVGSQNEALSTTLYLIRHGEIAANVNRHWHGSTDSALTETGRLQAQQMAAYIAHHHPEIAAVYCSPLQRTFHTASPLAKRLNLKLQRDDDLREYSIGELEGTAYEVLLDEHKFFDAIASSQDYAPAGGESPNEVCTRVVAALTRLKDRHSGQSIAIVSHGAAMGIALTHLLENRVYPFHEYHMVNTGYSKLVWSSEPKLEFFNMSDHLAGE